jgi:hypothetical protein
MFLDDAGTIHQNGASDNKTRHDRERFACFLAAVIMRPQSNDNPQVLCQRVRESAVPLANRPPLSLGQRPDAFLDTHGCDSVTVGSDRVAERLDAVSVLVVLADVPFLQPLGMETWYRSCITQPSLCRCGISCSIGLLSGYPLPPL